MLNKYYEENSVYLQRDTNDNKPTLSNQKRITLNHITKNHLIPFLQDNKIRSIKDITKKVYSDYKLYLQDKGLSAGYINNVLSSLNRILQYHERYEYIQKLPYSRGTGRVLIPEAEKERVKGNCLPFDKVRGIINLCYNLAKIPASTFKSQEILLLFSLGMTTGLRDKEISNIKVNDIKYAEKGDMYLLYVHNHKIDKYTVKTEKYRKIPLHPFIMRQIKDYIGIKNKKPEDYLFEYNTIRHDKLKLRMKTRLGKKYREEDFDKDKKNGGKNLSYFKLINAIVYLFIALNIRDRIRNSQQTRLIDKIKEAIIFSKEDIEKITVYTKEHNYHFYSFRHTITTIMGLEKLNPDFIDYVTGHLPEGKMRANYTHINTVDNALFCKEYGTLYLNVINKYFFEPSKEDKEKARKEATRNLVENWKKKEQKIEKNNGIFEVV
jgi:integrase